MWNLCSLLVAEPDCFVQGHDGPAYDIKFYGDSEDALLLRFGLVLISLSLSLSLHAQTHYTAHVEGNTFLLLKFVLS